MNKSGAVSSLAKETVSQTGNGVLEIHTTWGVGAKAPTIR